MVARKYSKRLRRAPFPAVHITWLPLTAHGPLLTNCSLGVAALNESVTLSLALNLRDFEPAAGAHGAPALRYTYYYHTTTVLEPSGGPSVGGTHVAVLGR